MSTVATAPGLPADLVAAVRALRFENPHDEKCAHEALSNPDEATQSTVAWLAALVARGGSVFDTDNKVHTTPHRWPLGGEAA